MKTQVNWTFYTNIKLKHKTLDFAKLGILFFLKDTNALRVRIF